MRRPLGVKGGVAVEMAIVLLPGLVALVSATELCRRAQIEIAMRHACFLSTRARALGSSLPRARARGWEFLDRAMPGRLGTQMGSHLKESVRVDRDLVLRLHYRYPALFLFPDKHHFEVTARCTFSRS